MNWILLMLNNYIFLNEFFLIWNSNLFDALAHIIYLCLSMLCILLGVRHGECLFRWSIGGSRLEGGLIVCLRDNMELLRILLLICQYWIIRYLWLRKQELLPFCLYKSLLMTNTTHFEWSEAWQAHILYPKKEKVANIQPNQ